MPSGRPQRADYDVLIVDDDADIREAVSMTLTEQGLTTAEASCGKKALEMLRSDGVPRLMVLDLMMPNLSGFEVLDVMRVDDELKDLPVIVMTALMSFPPLAVAHLLAKPFSPLDLLRAAWPIVKGVPYPG
jgi:CheY-like chemotaxis protein